MGYENPPEKGQIEISIFSRGIGECIVLRSANGKWIVIDSLLNQEKEPVALRYLRDIGIPMEDVSLIIASHWHDDHIRGLAKVVETCGEAKFAYSLVLCRDEFKAAVQNMQPANISSASSGVKELDRIGRLVAAQPDRRILASANTILSEENGLRVEALSPSHSDVQNFLADIAEWNSNGAMKIVSRPLRNDTSVVVVVHVEDELFLLGADLEVRGALSGWQGVHDLAWGHRGKSIFFKIAHHGSITGHYDPVWENLLEPEINAAVTPYARGVKKLPSQQDRERIMARTPNCYSAGSLSFLRSRSQHNTVQKTLNEADIEIWKVDSKLGQARFRKFPSERWTTELFGEACSLSQAA